MSSLVDLLGISSGCALFMVPHPMPLYRCYSGLQAVFDITHSVFSAGLLLQILVCFDSCINLQPPCSLPHSPAATPLCLVLLCLERYGSFILICQTHNKLRFLIKIFTAPADCINSPCSFLAVACSFPSEFFSFYWNVYLM